MGTFIPNIRKICPLCFQSFCLVVIVLMLSVIFFFNMMLKAASVFYFCFNSFFGIVTFALLINLFLILYFLNLIWHLTLIVAFASFCIHLFEQ
jgi:hypothetical protein